jgi:beta-N-acetylhexosaminidase
MSAPSELELERLAAGTLLASFAGSVAPAWLLHHAANGLGGVCLFGANATAGAVPGVAAVLHDAGPVVIALDEEGGDVTRLHAAEGSPMPGAAALGVVDDVATTEALHVALGAELAAAGIDLDLAPVADVNRDPANPVIGVRSFGADADLVARHVAAAVRGLDRAGVAACAKHFPGHGATAVDSHLELPVLDATLDDLHARELVPFRAAVAAGVASVMTAHLVVPAVDPVPATFSGAVIGGLLRTELGFGGVVVTDALDMGAAAGDGGIPAGVVRALAAGADLCCLGSGASDDLVRACIDAVVAAVRAGLLDEADLMTAVERVDLLRRRGAPGTAAPDRSDSHQLGRSAAARALRVEGDLRLPLRGAHVVELTAPAGIAAGEVAWGVGALLVELDPTTSVERVGLGDRPGAPPASRPLVVVVRDAHRHADQAATVAHLLADRPDAVVVELGWPDPDPPAAAARIVAHGASAAAGAAVARLLAGLSQEAAAIQ